MLNPARGDGPDALTGEQRPIRHFWGLSLRARLMIVGVAGLAVALTVGGVVLYRVLVFAVDRTLDNEALTAARDVAAMVDADRLPSALPVSGAQLVQVVDAEGRVAAGSANADRLVPLLRPDELAVALRGEAVVVRGSRAGVSGPLRVRAVAAGPESSRSSVIVALQVGDVLTSRAALRSSLLVVIPLLVLAVAAIAWRVIGWTLRPVEALRLGAERISGKDRQERLAVPRAADEIRALAVTLNSMLDRLAAARSRQQSFVADAAHELRSPLTSIRAQLEVAQHLGEGGDLPTDLMTDVTRLSALIEDLLLLARADADQRGPANPVAFDAVDLVREVASSYETARVPVRATSRVEVANVLADREELRRAVSNLVDNAVRHASTQVRLEVSTVELSTVGVSTVGVSTVGVSTVEVSTVGLRTGKNVVIGVLDDGPGIEPGDRERVFDRFTRLDEARDRDAGGSGLGLAIVRELVARAGGSVRLTRADEIASTRVTQSASASAQKSVTASVGQHPDHPGLRAEITLPLAKDGHSSAGVLVVDRA